MKFFFQITFLYWVKKLQYKILRFYVRTTNQSVFICIAADSGDISFVVAKCNLVDVKECDSEA